MNVNTPQAESLDAVPIPDGAVLLTPSTARQGFRGFALAALKQALAERHLDLPLGPEIDLENPERLVSLNRFAVQVVTSGMTADEISIPLMCWYQAGLAPQLLLAAQVDEENDVVWFPGVLTGAEFQELIPNHAAQKQEIALDPSQFRDGVDRLFRLVQLLEPSAISRAGLVAKPALASKAVSSVLDWLSGQLDEAFTSLGGELVPATAGAFRGVSKSREDALAVVSIPLGLDGTQLCSGEAASSCIERFRLLLIPIGKEKPDALLLRVVPFLEGDLLPEGLAIEAMQGELRESMTVNLSKSLELSFPTSDQLLSITIQFPDAQPLHLPPLQLPS